jgi:hypothetical protein
LKKPTGSVFFLSLEPEKPNRTETKLKKPEKNEPKPSQTEKTEPKPSQTRKNRANRAKPV